MEDYRVRVRIFISVIIAVLGILALQLIKLQIIDAQAYAGESRNNAVRESRTLPARGVIYDRNGRLVVENEPTYTIMLTPRYFDEAKAGLLAQLLEVPDTTVTRKLKEARAWSLYQASPSFREVPFETFSRVQENLYLLDGVTYEVAYKRRYRTDARAAHALGYVREINGRMLEQRKTDGYRPGDLIGQAGLEKRYEEQLRGTLGRRLVQVNVHGREVQAYQAGAEDQPPSSGYDLTLTLDSRVQALAESLFVGKRGGAVAIDPQTGEIISLVSMPDYDPEIFSKSVPVETWNYLTKSEDKPMFNRATMSGVMPGSTWKPFMSLMALQEGTITEDTKIMCRGGYLLGGRLFKDHAGHAHGPTAVRAAIQQSCNTFYYTMMMRTDVDTFSMWAKRFGFGREVSLDLGEQSPGLIPDSSYYNRNFPRGWTPGYTINLGIGQGDMLVTPLQLARYIAAVANKGALHVPHLVRELVHPETGERIRPERPETEIIPIDEAHFEVVREGMRSVMEAGTGRRAQVKGITSGGKTGTAQNPHGKDHSLFVMFAPYDDPKIAVAVLVENGGFGATQAAPIASLMVEQYLKGEIAPERIGLINYLKRLQSAAIVTD